MDLTCYYCGGSLTKTDKCPPNYLRCSDCNTFFSQVQPDYDYSGGKLREIYKQKILTMHQKDHGHYMRFRQTDEFKSIASHPFGTVFSFGGGVPKLESGMIFDHIISFDLNSDLYQEVMDEFSVMYGIEKQHITMRSDFVNPSLISGMKYESNDILTFVHFLEHLSPPDFVAIMDAIPLNQTVLIYQPEASKASNPSWFHFNDSQHLVLMEMASMIRFLQDWYNIEIITQRYNSDDMFLVFKKRINR